MKKTKFLILLIFAHLQAYSETADQIFQAISRLDVSLTKYLLQQEPDLSLLEREQLGDALDNAYWDSTFINHDELEELKSLL